MARWAGQRGEPALTRRATAGEPFPTPAAKAARAPSPTKRLPRSRTRVTLGEGRGAGERGPRPWRRLSACERSDHPSRSPRTNSRNTRSASDQQTPPSTAKKTFHGQAESRSHGASLPLPRNDIRSTKPAPPREWVGVRAKQGPPFDRGRESRMVTAPPPSKPDWRISRIRLSS